MVVLLPVMTRPLAVDPAFAPFSSMSTAPANSGWVVPSMVTASVIVGSGVAGVMVCAPAPGIAKLIRSSPARPFASRMAWRSDPAPLSLVLVTTNVDGPAATTVVVVVEELFAVSGSVPLAETVAVFDSTPACVGVTTMLTETVAPLATDPSTQVTVVVPLHDPIDALAETNVTVAGSVSVTVTLVPAFGPRFDTAIV